jgi:(p)ppGpp synthase/HD superfamily hydrolase
MNTNQLAHTHIQLINQLSEAGYSTQDLHLIFTAYQYCIELCDGFQPCGKPFITHLIRTASILVELKQGISIIAAGLLHSIYEFGDFGDGSRSLELWKRKKVRQRVGEEVENYIYQYDLLRWNENNITFIYNDFKNLEPVEKDVIIMRLSNELEQSLDLEPLYRSDRERKIQQIQNRKAILIDMARRLGYPTLANQLDLTFTQIVSVEASRINIHLNNSNFFSQMSARQSLKTIILKRLMGVVQKAKLSKI